MSLGLDYDEALIECHDCGLLYEFAETEGTCIRCNPQIARCCQCFNRALLKVVDDEGRAFCTEQCCIDWRDENEGRK